MIKFAGEDKPQVVQAQFAATKKSGAQSARAQFDGTVMMTTAMVMTDDSSVMSDDICLLLKMSSEMNVAPWEQTSCLSPTPPTASV